MTETQKFVLALLIVAALVILWVALTVATAWYYATGALPCCL